MDIIAKINNRINIVEQMIYEFLPVKKDHTGIIADATNYSVQAGGKRIRPILMYETYCMLSKENERDSKFIAPFLAGIEMIHTYSLVHDDLPAMDDDQYRRGKLTTHAKYGEAMGILAGDALLNLAYETVAKFFDTIEGTIDSENDQLMWYQRGTKALSILAKCAGMDGMVGGQVIDITYTGHSMEEALLNYMYELKTGELIKASFVVGAIMAGADDETIKKMELIAQKVGLAFQIQDDILDVTSTQAVLGKPIDSDIKNEKTTYVSLYGVDQCQKKVRQLSQEAVSLLHSFSKDSCFLEELIIYLATRDK